MYYFSLRIYKHCPSRESCGQKTHWRKWPRYLAAISRVILEAETEKTLRDGLGARARLSTVPLQPTRTPAASSPAPAYLGWGTRQPSFPRPRENRQLRTVLGRPVLEEHRSFQPEKAASAQRGSPFAAPSWGQGAPG